MMHSYILVLIFFGSNPTPEVALACGSASTNSVRYSNTAKLAAKLIAVVVFPTPPFGLQLQLFFPFFTLHLLVQNLIINQLG